MEGIRLTARAIALPVLGAVALVGCGGGQRQDADEPSGTFSVRVQNASIPTHQRLAEPTRMRMTVLNTGHETVPNVAVSVDAFSYDSQQPGLADPQRPVWIVNVGPRAGDTAYVSTWALGPLRPGERRTFVWHVTPVLAGQHTVHWRVAAGLNGKAHAVVAGNRPPEGQFVVRISSRPAQATVDPKTGAVVRSG